jgi:asparagine N-glycosylation enzyme membrane subunit Stt3
MANFFVSGGTAVAIVIGVVISFFYLRGMALALQKAAATVDEPDTGCQDSFSYSLIGAVVAVIASSLAIWSYGVSPACLYVGIALAMLSPVAVTYTFFGELRE